MGVDHYKIFYAEKDLLLAPEQGNGRFLVPHEMRE
jgi:hypothetical protein